MSSTNIDLEAQLRVPRRTRGLNTLVVAGIIFFLSACYLAWCEENGVELNWFEYVWAWVTVIGIVVTGPFVAVALKEMEERATKLKKEREEKETEERREEERRRWRREFEMELVEGVRDGGGPRVVMGVVEGEKR